MTYILEEFAINLAKFTDTARCLDLHAKSIQTLMSDLKDCTSKEDEMAFDRFETELNSLRCRIAFLVNSLTATASQGIAYSINIEKSENKA